MQAKRVFPFKQDRDSWVPTFFNNQTIPTLPNGKTFTFTPVIARPFSDYTDKGVSYINMNSGGSTTNYPSGKIGMFIFNPEFIKNSNPGKPLRQFTQQECNNAVDSFLSSKGGNIQVITSGALEAYNGLEPWTQSMLNFSAYNNDGSINAEKSVYACPSQYDWIDKRFAERLNAYGGKYYGNYDGHVATGGFLNNSGQPSGDPTIIRNALQSPEQALTLLRQNDQAGNPYLNSQYAAHSFRNGIINTYWAGFYDSHMRISQIMIGFLLNKKALSYLGNTTSRTMSFMFPNKQEFSGYLQKYKHFTNSGGYLDRDSFPMYSSKLNNILAYISLALADDLFGWEDTQLKGTNPEIVFEDQLKDQNNPSAGYVFRYVGNNPPARATSQATYEQGRNYPYVECNYGSGTDGMCEGVQWFSRACQWAGSSISFARVRIAGSSTWSSLNDTLVLDSYQQKIPIAFLHVSGSKRALYFFDLGSSPGTKKDFEVDLNGGTFVITAEGGSPYLYLFDQV